MVEYDPLASQLQELALNITVKLKHEPKAEDIVIQFVLAPGNQCHTVRKSVPHHHQKVAAKSRKTSSKPLQKRCTTLPLNSRKLQNGGKL